MGLQLYRPTGRGRPLRDEKHLPFVLAGQFVEPLDAPSSSGFQARPEIRRGFDRPPDAVAMLADFDEWEERRSLSVFRLSPIAPQRALLFPPACCSCSPRLREQDAGVAGQFLPEYGPSSTAA